MPAFIDLSGQCFGRLKVIEKIASRRLDCGVTRVMYKCLCDCGAFTEVMADLLRNGTTQSCGCLRREVSSAALTTHGMSNTRVFNIWIGVVRRCTNPADQAYECYSKLGIAPEFLDFMTFFKEVGHPPTDLHSIDRRDNSKGYVPGNIRWATSTQQNRNTGRNRVIEINGETRCLSEWALLHSLTDATVHKRLSRGWTPEEALGIVYRKPKTRP